MLRRFPLLLAALLVACSGSDEPVPVPEPTPASVEETPSPEPAGPALSFTDTSKLTFVSTKNETVEVPGAFTKVVGGLDLTGDDLSTLHGEFTVSLNSVDTAEPTRDLSIREALFGLVEDAAGDATVTLRSVAPKQSSLEVGASTAAVATLDLTLLGTTTRHVAKVTIGRTEAGWTVTSETPVSLSMETLGLGAAAAALKERCGHASLGDVVLVSVDLTLQ